MTVGVVDFLEVVDVQHDRRQRLAAALRPRHLIGGPRHEAPAVQRPGQGIGGGEPFQLALHVDHAGGGEQPGAQPCQVQRLAQELVGAVLHHFEELVGDAAGNHQHQVEVPFPLRRAQVPADLHPLRLADAEIDERDVDGLVAAAGQGHLAAFGKSRLMAEALKLLAQHRARHARIVHHQNPHAASTTIASEKHKALKETLQPYGFSNEPASRGCKRRLGWETHKCKRKSGGGWGGIRTHGGVAPTPVFKTGALNRSATHPINAFKDLALHVGGPSSADPRFDP
ncbi:protein of unknown function (plasmid) [Azospirillum baldaniorum]|uniref:Uncharacterized protein n=1 Tax=Azospirillum baldaniorum TaxID=1064539 RepID=A0A9P1NNF8_9PROT|nr:protein of unknown function [Azospirillum baldaniorum]